MAANIRRAALAYSKHRDAFGLVGVEVWGASSANPQAYLMLAKSWPRSALSTIPARVSQLWKQARWDDTVTDQLAGQHLIQHLRAEQLPVTVVTTQKDLKDPAGIEKTEIMDKIEAVQFVIWLRQAARLHFPARPSEGVRLLEEQMALFTEHKTEAGSVDYFAPGAEHDDVVKALVLCLFSLRSVLEVGRDLGGRFAGGPLLLDGHHGRRHPTESDAATLQVLLDSHERVRRATPAEGGDEWARDVAAAFGR